MLIDLSFIFFYSFASLFIMRKVAKRFGLVDRPDHRKNHLAVTPIAGGIAICIILSNLLYTRPDLTPHNDLLLVSIVLLTVIGTLDDRFDLNVFFRLSGQVLLSIAFIYYSGFQITHLGDLFGFGEIELNWLSGVITTAAILGAMNAFNMIDGLDGLLGMLSVITFASLALLLGLDNQFNLAYFCVILMVSITPYICMNLGCFGRKRKVFMGDAGSMMIGFIVVWLLLSASQGPHHHNAMSPITVLWLIAVPLMDMTATITRRLKQGKSPFHCDQEHIHFILQNLGFSANKTLLIISGIASVFAGLGILGELFDLADPLMFYGFLALYLVYYQVLARLQAAVLQCKDNAHSIDAAS